VKEISAQEDHVHLLVPPNLQQLVKAVEAVVPPEEFQQLTM
jgi:hypothetical protein